ncbi:MAG: LPS export ABC transporter periplasmic protein LptC, partial [Candidatus Omnitrophica bacterium]|nr:LPS export ABC transporter periplasmic protein LptC [Candidatus Omnitrophota bacterium]
KKWEVKGESAEAVSESEIRLDNIIAKAYGAEALAVITADKGIYDKSKNNVKLEENVKATIETSEGAATDFIDFPGQMAGSSDSKEVGRGKSKEMKTVITCDGEVEFDYEKDYAYFNKNVKVASDDGNIDADRITINLDPTTKRISEIVAEGDVKITRGENITYSQKATYITGEKKVILSGSPRLVIYNEGDIEKSFAGQ